MLADVKNGGSRGLVNVTDGNQNYHIVKDKRKITFL